ASSSGNARIRCRNASASVCMINLGVAITPINDSATTPTKRHRPATMPGDRQVPSTSSPPPIRSGLGDNLLRLALELCHLLAQRGIAALHHHEVVLDLGGETTQFGFLACQQGSLASHRHFHLAHLGLQRFLVLAQLLAIAVELLPPLLD